MLYRFDSRKDFEVVKSKLNSQNQLLFERVDLSKIDYSKKSVIILCGNNSRSMSRAEYYSYLCRGWIRNIDNQLDLTTYAIYYPNYQPLFNENSLIELDYRTLAEGMFKKVLFKNGNPRSVEDIKKSLGNVMFFGHSAGGYVMNELMKTFGEIMYLNKFTKAEIKSIYDSIVFVAYAPYSLVDAPIKSIYIAPVYDTMGSTKLIYNKMLKSKNVSYSKPKMDLFGENKIIERTKPRFMSEYKKKMNGKNTLYFRNKNIVASTPNLLFDDGRKEDHNFAGVINYKRDNPYQTQAGRLTAKFLNSVFDYCLSTKREKFDINEIYDISLEIKFSDESLNI